MKQITCRCQPGNNVAGYSVWQRVSLLMVKAVHTLKSQVNSCACDCLNASLHVKQACRISRTCRNMCLGVMQTMRSVRGFYAHLRSAKLRN